MSQYRILVVDDYPDAALIICQLLQLQGHETTLAVSGTEALAVATTFAPEIALVDIGLPDLSGFDVARRLRAELPGPLYLVAISGWAQAGDRVKALAAGFDHFVSKPIDGAVAALIVAKGQTYFEGHSSRSR